jgi:hypothetical protein
MTRHQENSDAGDHRETDHREHQGGEQVDASAKTSSDAALERPWYLFVTAAHVMIIAPACFILSVHLPYPMSLPRLGCRRCDLTSARPR